MQTEEKKTQQHRNIFSHNTGRLAKFGWILTYLKIRLEMSLTRLLPGAIQLAGSGRKKGSGNTCKRRQITSFQHLFTQTSLLSVWCSSIFKIDLIFSGFATETRCCYVEMSFRRLDLLDPHPTYNLATWGVSSLICPNRRKSLRSIREWMDIVRLWNNWQSSDQNGLERGDWVWVRRIAGAPALALPVPFSPWLCSTTGEPGTAKWVCGAWEGWGW